MSAAPQRCVAVPPAAGHYLLADAHVPTGCVHGALPPGLAVDVDNLARLDIEVRDGKVAALYPAGAGAAAATCPVVDLRGKMVLPTFADLHTHIDKGHTTERSRNPNGSLSGADRSTARDAAFWDEDDVYRRMDFSLRCAYAHGTSALRTHLINMSPKQTQLTWPAFARLRAKWAGKVELQGVSLVVLSFFRDAEAARQLADLVAGHGGILGAAVCCAEQGGDPSDDWTTCEADRDQLLDRIFTLAKERDLDLDFHTDENGNALARGLRYVAQKAVQHGYQGRVVCGHCCSLAFQPPEELRKTLEVAREAGVTVVSLPLVNQWTQDRSHEGGRTPRWRGVTLLHELRAAGVPTAISSDNVRDQFYAYGDLDMLEVFTQSCRMAHLDRPYGDWPQAVTSVPADAMRLREHGRIGVGLPANLVVFRGRRYSELLSRPQHDRVVVRDGRPLAAVPPPYEELDYVPAAIKSGNVPLMSVGYEEDGKVVARSAIGAPPPGTKLRGKPLLNGCTPSVAAAAGSSPSLQAWGLGGGSRVALLPLLLLSCLVAALAAAAGGYQAALSRVLPSAWLASRQSDHLLCAADGAAWKPGNIWPKPNELTSDCRGGATLSLRGATLAAVDVRAGERQAGEAYVRRAWELAQQHDWPNCTAGGDVADGPSVSVTVEDADCVAPACFTAASDESYELLISPDGTINITTRSIFGVNPALASLASLAVPAGVTGAAECEIGCLPLEVRDSPRFGHRGVMLDTSRNWFSIDDIKARLLDPMHLTKLNVMHWHVYDSQSQPLEVRSIPGLWQPYSAAQNYTQAQARELIAFAFARGIRVLPEFDMPGHTAIFSKAAPELVACLDALPWDGADPAEGGMCNQPPCGQLKPEAAGLAVGLIQEWLALFPNSIVSTGADEVNFNCWNEGVVNSSSPGYQAFERASLAKLKGFQEQVAAAVTGANRTFGVWEESFSMWGFAGTPALPAGSTLFAWLGTDSINNATRAGYDVIAVPYQSWYLDCGLGVPGGDNWCNPLKNWTTMYEFDPTATVDASTGGDPSRVLGGQVAMWSEHLRPVLLDYAVWPRAAAAAERLWSRAEDTQSAEAARPRLQQLMRQLQAYGLRPSSLEYEGLNWRYDLLPQWCDTVARPQVSHEGVDYCGAAPTYKDVDLSVFENLVLPPY